MDPSQAIHERRLLRHLRHCGRHWLAHQVLPVVRSSAKDLQLSVNMVQRDRAELYDLGFLTRAHGRGEYRLTAEGWAVLRREHPAEFGRVDDDGRPRPSLEDLLAGQGLRRVPVLPEQIAAGLSRQLYEPIDANEVDEYLVLPSSTVGAHGDLMAVEVSGESMIGEHILPGDLAILRRTNEVPRNAIVGVALEDDSVTLKRYEAAGPRARLWSANPSMPDPIEIDVDPGDFGDRRMPHIIGVYVGLVRPSDTLDPRSTRSSDERLSQAD